MSFCCIQEVLIRAIAKSIENSCIKLSMICVSFPLFVLSDMARSLCWMQPVVTFRRMLSIKIDRQLWMFKGNAATAY